MGGATAPKLEVRFAPAWLYFLPAVWGDYWFCCRPGELGYLTAGAGRGRGGMSNRARRTTHNGGGDTHEAVSKKPRATPASRDEGDEPRKDLGELDFESFVATAFEEKEEGRSAEQ